MDAPNKGYSNNPQVNREMDSQDDYFLMLHNDDINTFEHVIDSLVKICLHDHDQAEQCALITHFKGLCDVKKGNFASLHEMRKELILNGLTATVE